MKNVKLLALLVLVMIGTGFNLSAQNVSSVIVSARVWNYDWFEIEVVGPDYEVTKKPLQKGKEENLSVSLKKELDNWLKQGYKIASSYTTKSIDILSEYVQFILVKDTE